MNTSSLMNAARMFLFGLIWSGTAVVQAQSGPLSLSGAIQKALVQNFDIQIEEKRVELTGLNNTWGAAGRYPTVTLQVNANNRLSNIDNPASFVNGRLLNIGATGTANVAWTLFNGFQVSLSKARLDKLDEQSAGNAALVVENTLQAIILQYYTCLVEEEALATLAANLSLSRDRLAFEQTRQELGSGSTFNVLTARTAYLSDSSNYLSQELNRENAIRALAQLMGDRTEEVSYTLSDELPADFSEYRLDDLSAKMEANNQTLRNQFINLEILQKDLDLARASRYPRLDLNLGGTYSISRLDLESVGAATANQVDYYANFSLNFTLFNGGAISRSIESAQINERLGMLTIQQLKHSMSYQLLNAFELYRTRRQLLAVAEATVEAARQNEAIAEDKFRAGTINSFNYRDVQIVLLQASLSRIRAVFAVLDAETQLLRLTGGILDLGETE
ncbi:MAG: TolC family protein [Bacteroidota bacterium]